MGELAGSELAGSELAAHRSEAAAVEGKKRWGEDGGTGFSADLVV